MKSTPHKKTPISIYLIFFVLPPLALSCSSLLASSSDEIEIGTRYGLIIYIVVHLT